MKKEEQEDFLQWLREQGKRVTMISEFVHENFDCSLEQKNQIKEEMMDKGLQPYHFFKKEKSKKRQMEELR